MSFFGTSSGKRVTVLFGRVVVAVRATVRVPAPPCRAAAAAASAAASRPASDRSLVWANPVVSPAITRMPAPRSRPLVTCSTRPSSSPADVDRFKHELDTLLK